jgi:hypothetical protein
MAVRIGFSATLAALWPSSRGATATRCTSLVATVVLVYMGGQSGAVSAGAAVGRHLHLRCTYNEKDHLVKGGLFR